MATLSEDKKILDLTKKTTRRVTDATFLIKLSEGPMTGAEILEFLKVTRGHRHRRLKQLGSLITQTYLGESVGKTLIVGLTPLGKKMVDDAKKMIEEWNNDKDNS